MILSPSLFVFIVVYFVSMVLTIGFLDWFVVWIGLEMNMMMFMGLSYYRKDFKVAEGLYKYFFVQSLSSGVYLGMIYIGGWMELVFMVSLAAGPFYFWLPSVMKSMGWWNCYLLMIVQSMLPLSLLSSFNSSFIMEMGVLSLILGALGSLNQVSLRSLMVFSSVNHLGWMFISMFLLGYEWFKYFILYAAVLFPLVYWFWEKGVFFVPGSVSQDLVVMIFMLLSLGGVPPLLGFLGKMIIFMELVVIDLWVSLVMIMTSLLMIYIYIRAGYESVMGGGVLVSWFSEKLGFIGMILFLVLFGTFFFPFFYWLL